MSEHCENQADDVLVGRALAGNTHAFAQLCERHRTRIWRVANSVARGPDAEDLTQEVVLRAFRALRSYQRQAPFGAWICRIAVNAAHDYHRSAWRRRVTLMDELPDGPDSACPHGDVERRELQRRVRQAVAALPEKQRAPIWLHYFEGFPMVEVARLERAPEATVRSRVRAGLRRLSFSLEDLVPAGEPQVRLEAGSRA
jgi:RNA polymerase sigma-70 factor (ECF subfamily)